MINRKILIVSLIVIGIIILILLLFVFREKKLSKEDQGKTEPAQVTGTPIVTKALENVKEETTENIPEKEGYYGTLYIHESPFSGEQSGQLRLELIQDGERSIVFDENVKSDSFPRSFFIEGVSEEMGVVEVFTENEKSETIYTIPFLFQVP